MRLPGGFILYFFWKMQDEHRTDGGCWEEKDKLMSDSRAQLCYFSSFRLSQLFHVVLHKNLVWPSWKLAAAYFLQSSSSQTGRRWKHSQGF